MSIKALAPALPPYANNNSFLTANGPVNLQQMNIVISKVDEIVTAINELEGGSFPFAQHITDATESTTPFNGSFVTDGGVGIAKNLNVGGAMDIKGNGAVEGTFDVKGVTTFEAQNVYKATVGKTALAGGAQAGTALTAEFNEFTTVVTTGDSAQLPVGAVGSKVTVKNSAAIAMAVFGQTSDAIDGAAANASFNVGPGQEVTFERTTTTAWQSREGTSLGTISQVTQITSTTTGVAVNSKKGIITTYATTNLAALGACTFTVTNNKITATSNVRVWIVDYAGTILTNGVPVIVGADNRTAGTFDIIYANTHATNALAGVLQIGFEVIN